MLPIESRLRSRGFKSRQTRDPSIKGLAELSEELRETLRSESRRVRLMARQHIFVMRSVRRDMREAMSY